MADDDAIPFAHQATRDIQEKLVRAQQEEQTISLRTTSGMMSQGKVIWVSGVVHLKEHHLGKTEYIRIDCIEAFWAV